MTIKIIIEEYYNLICEMNYLLILSNGTLEDSENIQFIMEKVLINDDFKNINLEKIFKHLYNSIDDDNLNHKIINYLKNLKIFGGYLYGIRKNQCETTGNFRIYQR